MAIDIAAIQQYLNTEGIKHSKSGYRYLAMAIMIGVEHPDLLNKISELYDEVASQYNKKPENISKAIRNAILLTNQTNKEFIARAIILLGLQEYES